MYRKVIWATDGSEHADRAMSHAVQVAKADGAELHVVHVIEKLVSGRAAGLNAFANEDEVKAKIETQARTIAGENGLKTSVHMSVGASNRIGDRIAGTAVDLDADLIVVGTRGHGAMGSLVLGGVTQRLLHVARCPVLAVPPAVPAKTETPSQPAVTAG